MALYPPMANLKSSIFYFIPYVSFRLFVLFSLKKPGPFAAVTTGNFNGSGILMSIDGDYTS